MRAIMLVLAVLAFAAPLSAQSEFEKKLSDCKAVMAGVKDLDLKPESEITFELAEMVVVTLDRMCEFLKDGKSFEEIHKAYMQGEITRQKLDEFRQYTVESYARSARYKEIIEKMKNTNQSREKPLRPRSRAVLFWWRW